MSYAKWEEKSLNFFTKLAKNPAVQPIWDKFEVRDQSEIQLLQSEIRRALFADEEIPDDENHELISGITTKCIHHSQHESVTDIAVIYVCVRVENPISEHIVPIFRVQNCSKKPEDCNVIDHLGNLYTDFESYLMNNTWYQNRLMIPLKAQYRLNKNETCSVLIRDQTSRVLDNETFNRDAELINVTTSIELTGEKIISSYTLMDQAQQAQITDHRNKLKDEHLEKFDALRLSHHETAQPGEIRKVHGDRTFNKSMSIDDINKYFDNLSLTTDGKLKINNKLTIHPKAFVQLSEQERLTIIEATKELEDEKISRKDFHNQIQHIRKDYRLKLDEERSDYEKYLEVMFEVSNLKDVKIGGGEIFANLKPNEIDRLHQVTKCSLCEDISYVRLGIDFSTKAEAKNLMEFCAASEYVVRKVQEEIKKRRRQNPDPEGRGNKKPKNFFKDKVMAEFRAEGFKTVLTSFQDLRNECDIAIKYVDPSFKNSFAAANHYDKHNLLPKVDEYNSLSPETYFDIAHDMTSAFYSEVQWTQDGSSLMCTYQSETFGAVAIKFVSLPDKTGVIATLLENNKNRKVMGSRYYYHPDY